NSSIYLQAKVLSLPFFIEKSGKIDEEVLKSPHGKFLKHLAKYFVADFGSDTQFFQEVNRKLANGTCRGECLALALAGSFHKMDRATALVFHALQKILKLIQD